MLDPQNSPKFFPPNMHGEAIYLSFQDNDQNPALIQKDLNKAQFDGLHKKRVTCTVELSRKTPF